MIDRCIAIAGRTDAWVRATPRDPGMALVSEVPWSSPAADWDAPGFEDRRITTGMVADLAAASTEGEAAGCYRKIDGIPSWNGYAYPAAIPFVQTAVACLPLSTPAARPYLLDLLSQVFSCVSAPGARGVRERCTAELRPGFSHLLHGLRFGEPALVPYHVDLLAELALAFSDLRPRVKRELEQCLLHDANREHSVLIRNVLRELR